MKRLLTIVVLSTFAFVCAFTACGQFEEPAGEAIGPDETEAEASDVAGAKTRAGEIAEFEIMENPYTLERMQRLSENYELQRTHIYVRFLPADSAQLNLLEDVLDLDLLNFDCRLGFFEFYS